MRKISFIGLILLFQVGIAQLFVPDYLTAFSKEYSFNKSFLKKNQIKKVVLEIIDKKDFQAPIDRNLVEHYEFHTNGNIKRNFHTEIIKTLTREENVPAIYKNGKRIRKAYSQYVQDYVYDTISTTYLYNEKDSPIMKRDHLGYGFYDTRYYNYDEEGYLIKETRYKETNLSNKANDFILGNQVRVSIDSMSIKKYENQYKVSYYNSDNRPYKEVITNKKENKVVNVDESYVSAAWIRQSHKFEYDTLGRLVKAGYFTNANTPLTYFHTYDYDTNGWLLTDKYYKNDELLTETSYVNDFKSNLVSSIVMRDYKNLSIRIIKLRYAYMDTIQVKND
ncbi:MAG: hypothetical protein AB7O73_05240 [Bacteroidia bacterium]